MRPLSPAALEKLYRDSMWEERQRKADEATAAFDLEGLKEVATNALGHTCNAVYHLAQGRHIVSVLTIVNLLNFFSFNNNQVVSIK